MKYPKKYKLLPLAALVAVSCSFFAGCTDIALDDESDDSQQKEKNILEVRHFSLDDNSKKIVLETVLTGDIGDVCLDDESVTVQCEETDVLGKPFNRRAQPTVTSVKRSAAALVAANDIHLDVLIDLTLSKDEVDIQKNALLQMRGMFSPENMSVVFMTDSGVTEAMPASDYVIDAYCKQSSDHGDKMLYRAMLSCLEAGIGSEGQDTVRRVFVAFSNGEVYSGVRQLDPEHFNNQDKLISLSSSSGPNLVMYYVNLATDEEDNETGVFIRQLCSNMGGLYQDSFNWKEIEKNMFNRFGIEYVDYTFILTNPDNKVYDGKKHVLSLQCIKDGHILAGLQTEYYHARFYMPIIVNGKSSRQILLLGIILSLGCLALVYVLLQIIVPKIRKILFDRKYVASYEPNMSISGVLVDNTCYYCKAPFEPGERIVAKCCHTMHEQCWNENGYHCPEYGRNCKHGSHYYNPHRILDPGNSSFHMPWIILATIAGTLSWIIFSTIKKGFFVNIITSVTLKLLNLKVGTPEAADFITSNIDTLNRFPSFGLYMGMLLTLAMSILTVHRRGFLRTSAEVLLRSAISGIFGAVFFLLSCIVAALINNNGIASLLSWIPWALTGITIILCSSIGTSTPPKRYMIFAAIATGFLSMFIWEVILAGLGADYRVWLLLSHILFSVCIALSIARDSPVAQRYFLHIGGSIKDMDIAVYKWFEANSNRIVTIGRSVDCDLVMSWDVKGDIAPVQAKLTKSRNRVYLTPLENGVFSRGRKLPIGKPFRLFHGRTLTIGTTDLVYLEKDI